MAIRTKEITKEITQDIHGEPLVNSAGEPFDPPVTIEELVIHGSVER